MKNKAAHFTAGAETAVNLVSVGRVNHHHFGDSGAAGNCFGHFRIEVEK